MSAYDPKVTAELLALDEKRTKGEWSAPKPGWHPPECMGMRDNYPAEGWHPDHHMDYRVNSDLLDCEEENGICYQCTEEDSEFIAAAPRMAQQLRAASEIIEPLRERAGRAIDQTVETVKELNKANERIERLELCLRRINSVNDNPACFSKDIDQLIRGAAP